MECGADIYFWRQCLYWLGVALFSFTAGNIMAFPAVMNTAILDPNSEIKVTPDQASWIASCYGFGGILAHFVAGLVFQFLGRKVSNIRMNVFPIVGCLALFLANDVYTMMFARFLQGMSGGAFTSAMALCECASPKRRGYFMVLNKASIGLGGLACHALGFVITWRQMTIVGAIPAFLSIIIFLVCPESPSFYASRGQFHKCTSTFKWYRGDTEETNNELKELVSAQARNWEEQKREKTVSTIRHTIKILKSRDFIKSFYIMTLITICMESCGRYFLLAYMTQIIEELSHNRSFAMYMSVAFDCIFIVSLCISCIIVKYFKRRTLVFNFGFASVFLMFLVSATLILDKKFPFLHDAKWLIPTIILFHTFVTNIGLVPIAYTMYGEIFPLEHKGVGSFSSGLMFVLFYTLTLKITPMMIADTGVEGTYFIFGLCLFICLFLLKMILVETKDKTLQQIEDELKGIESNEAENKLLKNSQVND